MQQLKLNIYWMSTTIPLLNDPTEQFIVWTDKKGPQVANYDADGFYNSRGKIIKDVTVWARVPDPAAESDEQSCDRVAPIRRKQTYPAYPLLA